MAAGRVPIPPWPRWCGMTATFGPPRGDGAGHLSVVITVPPLTRRARLWAAWRLLTAREAPDAPADR
jgi:hypothetical protein